MYRIFLVFTVLVVLTTAFTSIKPARVTQADPGVDKIMEVAYLWDVLAEAYVPDQDRDGTWLEVGIRAKYAMAKKYVALNLLEAAFGEKVFLEGPHGAGVNYQSMKDFGHYNPKFIAGFRGAWETAVANPEFREILKNIYYKHIQGMAAVYYDAYRFLNQDPALLKILQEQYLAEMNSSAGVDSYTFNSHYSSFASLEERKNLDVYDAYTAPGFWLRRSIDGTAEQLFALQVMMMQTFELDFTARVSAVEKEEYMAIIQELLPALNAAGEIQNHQYPVVETYVNNANVVIDDRDQEIYNWITLKDGNNWLVQNTRFSFSGSSNADCSYCQTYGRLYTWDMALKACPKGWRLPTEKEWDNLLEVYGGGKLIDSDGSDNPYTKYQAYQALQSGLPSGFIFPLGGRMGSFGVENFESEGYYWSSTPKNSSEAWQYNFISYDGAKINKYEASKKEAYSCRCIQE